MPADGYIRRRDPIAPRLIAACPPKNRSRVLREGARLRDVGKNASIAKCKGRVVPRRGAQFIILYNSAMLYKTE